MRLARLLLIAILCATLWPTPLDVLRGTPRIIDGDTIEIAGIRGRLEGIDAPEDRQACEGEHGRAWRCGRGSAEVLGRLTAAGVACLTKGIDRYGRALLSCTSGGRDLGGAMVETGFALAYRAYSSRYVEDERRARQASAGVWAGAFVDPWSYRKSRRRQAAHPGGCAIKGNISSGGRIYHVPGTRHYDRTRIDPARGERWFCSATEAEAAGWRAPHRG